MLFPELSPDSRVWIYTSDRPFSDEERYLINNETGKFMREWAAHGDKLFGDFTLLENRFIVLCVDESKIPASGCSIDSSVRFIKSLGQKLNIDFFNRLNFYLEEEGEIISVHFADLKQHSNGIVYNSLVNTNEEITRFWRKPVSDF